jgi:glycosyltransferase involved in cell wall biosynthesis
MEVIVVNDGSTDDTGPVLDEFARRTHLNFIPITQANGGPAVARNRGVEYAGGEFVAFTDDDCVVHRGWLLAVVGGFADAQSSTRVGGVGGVMRSRARGLIGSYMETRNTVSSYREGMQIPPFVITANACFPRQLLLSIGGFDNAIKSPGGEDIDLCWRIVAQGYTVKTSPDAIVYHHQASRLLELLRRLYNYGKGDSVLARKYGVQMNAMPTVGAPEKKRGLHRLRAAVQQYLVDQGILSPKHFAHRMSLYRTGFGLGWRTAMAFAALDHLSQLARRQGYLQGQRQIADSIR